MPRSWKTDGYFDLIAIFARNHVDNDDLDDTLMEDMDNFELTLQESLGMSLNKPLAIDLDFRGNLLFL